MKAPSKRQLNGIVTSDKMTKTVIVKVEAFLVHPKYLKRYRVFKKYAAHNELADIKVGDKVVIEESKPMSRTKNWRVIAKA